MNAVWCELYLVSIVYVEAYPYMNAFCKVPTIISPVLYYKVCYQTLTIGQVNNKQVLSPQPLKTKINAPLSKNAWQLVQSLVEDQQHTKKKLAS